MTNGTVLSLFLISMYVLLCNCTLLLLVILIILLLLSSLYRETYVPTITSPQHTS